MLCVGGRVTSFVSLDEAVRAKDILGGTYIVVLSMAAYKAYGLLLNRGSITKIPEQMCLAEMVLHNTARPCIDFDCDIEPMIPMLRDIIYNYYKEEYDVHVTIAWRWSYLTSKNWHCIISGVYYKGCWKEGCLRMSSYLAARAPHVQIDNAIYKNNSSLRMIGQCKYVDNRYCKKLHPLERYDIDDMYVTHSAYDFHMDKEDTSIRASYKMPQSIPSNKLPVGMALGNLMFNNPTSKIYKLWRVSPSYCELCKRTHDKENAMMIVRGRDLEIRCFREPRDEQGRLLVIHATI